MKRTITLLLSLVLVLTLFAGCNQSSSSTNASYVILDEVLADEEYGIGFRKGDQTLRDEVQKILVDMKKDGKLAEITIKWFDKDTSIVPDTFTPAASSDDSLKKIKDKGEFILGLDDSFPPMGYDKNGEIVGYDIDLAREVCSRMGVTLKLQPINWDQKEMELESGTIDCIWNGMTINEERIEKMNMSEPYMANRQVVVTLERPHRFLLFCR